MSRTVRVLLVFVAALGLFAERAAAQIPARDGTFYACVRIDRAADEARLARLVAANEPCRRNETRVHWSQTGPQGVPGTNGIDGRAGAPGTNGIDGAIGAAGINGIDGRDGAPGTNGINGADGALGTRPLPAGPCFDNSNRYVDCGNGTVTDTVTGLIWLKDAACLGIADWAAANGAAAKLANSQCGLTDGSLAGDWRLPTMDEWAATIKHAYLLGCRGLSGGPPSLTNDAGTACMSSGLGLSSFAGVVSDRYWSSTTDEFPEIAWFADLFFGNVNDYFYVKVNAMQVWPVRGGPH